MADDIKTRDERLAKYIGEGILKELDSGELTVLNDYFSNVELQQLSGQPLEVVKSSIQRFAQNELERRMTYIHPAEYPSILDWYKTMATEIYEIHCTDTEQHKDGTLIGIEITLKQGEPNPRHIDGRYVIPVGDNLMASRPRLDGVMGYECRCKMGNGGKSDTRWSDIEKELILRDHIMTSLTNEDIMTVKHELNVRNHVPNVKKTKLGYKIETFEIRKVF